MSGKRKAKLQSSGVLPTMTSIDRTLEFTRAGREEQRALLTGSTPEYAGDLLKQLPPVQAVELLAELPAAVAAAILNLRPSNEQADYLGDLSPESAKSILAAMNPEEARDAHALSRYPDHLAGGLMVTEYLAFPRAFTVAQILDDLREHSGKYRDYEVQYAYVVDSDRKLAGVLRLRDLLLADRTQSISTLMIPNPLSVSDRTELDELRGFFERHRFLGVPVVDEGKRLVGVILRAAVEEALADQGISDYRKSQGIIGGEELRSMPILLRSRRRLSWLCVNIVLNIIAVSVIALYEDTLTSVIALAIFLPIISDMSGCAGNQAVAVSMRELALGLIAPMDAVRVAIMEALPGLINGIVLGILLALVVWLWKGNPYLGMVIGSSLALSTLIAVILGGLLPLLMKRLSFDPALASGPILTSITDMFGFLLVLSLAKAMLPRLVAA